MANEKQFKLKTIFVATRGVEEYRQSITRYIQPTDHVLEIGCEWGTTSALLYKQCKNILATDISQECLERGRTLYPYIAFTQLDAFDIASAMKLGTQFSKIYIDMSGISGYRSLLDTIALLQMYATIFSPEVIVIKSGSLKNFAQHCKAWETHQ